MQKNFITVLLFVAAFSLAGCGSGKDEKNRTSIKHEKQTAAENRPATQDDENNKETVKEKKQKKERKGLDKISYTYRCNPLESDHGNDKITLGCYYYVELDEDSENEYPELDKVIEKYNSGSEREVREFVEGSTDEVIEMWEQGFTGYYEYDKYFHPVRADEKVFSFVEETYEFYGGAHGSTAFRGFNYDPATGKSLEFDDVVSDTSDLPDIIFDELIRQNPDLKAYFDELPSDRENLIKGIPDRLEDNAEELAWALDYDGIRINFEDYAMGSYAVGIQCIKIRFKDYPEIFTDRYADYENGRVPEIDDIATKLEDAHKEVINADNSKDGNRSQDMEKPLGVDIIKLDKDEQYKLNVFLSNFAEQGFSYYDEAEDRDVQKLTDFAYMWVKINRYKDIESEGSYYRISLDKVRNIVDKYFGIKLSDDELYGYDWSVSQTGSFCKGGYYYVPAADGESYTGLAVVEQAEDMGDGTYWLYFTTFNLDLDVYWDNNEVISKKYYSMSYSEALDSGDLEAGYGGMAIVKKDGGSYKLQYYKMY